MKLCFLGLEKYERWAADIMDECCREALADFLAVTVCKSSVLSGISLDDRSIIYPNLASTVNGREK